MFENDIAMCFGENCELKDKCYRYLATPDEYQTYLVDIAPKDGKCDHFWNIKKENDRYKSDV